MQRVYRESGNATTGGILLRCNGPPDAQASGSLLNSHHANRDYAKSKFEAG